MSKYSFGDFLIGDRVYHLSNSGLFMVVIEKNEQRNELSCRWISKEGIMQVVEFMPEELGKAKDLGPHIR